MIIDLVIRLTMALLSVYLRLHINKPSNWTPIAITRPIRASQRWRVTGEFVPVDSNKRPC